MVKPLRRRRSCCVRSCPHVSVAHMATSAPTRARLLRPRGRLHTYHSRCQLVALRGQSCLRVAHTFLPAPPPRVHPSRGRPKSVFASHRRRLRLKHQTQVACAAASNQSPPLATKLWSRIVPFLTVTSDQASPAPHRRHHVLHVPRARV
jgi:hypothetical protein